MVKGSTGKIKTEDGLSLYYRHWSGESSEPILLFVHGLGEHSGRYGHTVEYFNDKGYTIYAYDQRGHGRSGGKRAFTECFARLLGDFAQILHLISKREGKRKKVFVIAHSFGAQVVLTYVARHPHNLAGLIVSSPNIRLKMPVPALKKKVGSFLNHFIPGLAVSADVKPEYLSHDQEVVEAYWNYAISPK